MKVKMKVKHLVTSVIAFTALLFVFILFIQPQLEIRGINQQIEAGNVNEAKNAILEKIENDRHRQIQMDLIREYMIEPQPWGDRFDVYISPSMTTFGSVSPDRLFNIEESEPYLQLYIKEAPADGYLRRAITLLQTSYKRTGQFEKAEATIKEGLTRFSKDQYAYHDLQLMKIELAITSKNYDRAQLLIDDYKPKMNDRFTDTFLQLSKFVAEMLIQKGEYDQAYEYLMEEIEKHEEWHNDLLADISDDELTFNDGMIGSSYFQALVKLRDQLQLMKRNNHQLSIVKGKVVRSNGDPVANAGVYLRPEEDVSRSVIEGDRQVITGSDGSFSFIGVLPGSYQITVGFMFEQIDGWAWPVENNDWIDVKEGETIEYPVVITPLIEQISPANDVVLSADEVTFSWEAFPGAATYELSGNIHVDHGSIGGHLLSGITENEITIPVEQLYSIKSGTMFRGDDFIEVEPASILGFANPEGTFSWSVKAYNEDGDLISQSNGYRLREETMGAIPFFQLKARQLTEADETFLRDGNIEQALKMYKENVEANLDDLHSLRMVTRLMAIELERDSDALPYWIALAEKANDAEAMFEVFMHYYELEKWQEANEWFERYRENIAGPIPSYSKSIYAATLMKQGEIEEARDYFYEVLDEDLSNRFVGFLLAIELYLQEDWKHVEQLAVQYKERGMNAPDWGIVFRDLRNNVAISNVKVALKHFFAGQQDDLDEYLEKIDQRALSQFINELQNVR